jgi:hypothetical protein
VIDAVDLVFVATFNSCWFKALAESRSWPKGFSMITRRQWPLSSVIRPTFASRSTMSPKNLGAVAM